MRTESRVGLGIACCLLLTACGLLLAACEMPPVELKPQPTDHLPDPTPSTAEITLTATLTPGLTLIVFWEPYPLDRPEGDVVVRIVHAFEAQNPDVRVQVVARSGVLGVDDALVAQIAAGEELPDLAVAFPSSIASLAQTGVVAPLDAYVNDPEVGLSGADLSDLYPGFLDSGRFPGLGRQLLAIPFVQNAVGMWVNDSLLGQAGWKSPPATWSEFEQACLDVQAATGSRCLPFVESVSLLDAWLYSRGGRPLSDDGGRAEFNSAAGVQSLALLRRLMDAGLAWRPQDEYGDYLEFTQGQAAFVFGSTGNNHLYKTSYDQAVKNGMAAFDWRQVMIPQADPAQPATVSYGTSFFIVKGEPDRQTAAWRLIRWFLQADQTALWAPGLQALPARASALAVMTDTLAAYPFMAAQVTDILPHARPEPAVPAELQVREILYTAIVSVTQSGIDPQVALDTAAGQANSVLSGQP